MAALYLLHASGRAFFDVPAGTAVARAVTWLADYWRHDGADITSVERDGFEFRYPAAEHVSGLHWYSHLVAGGSVDVTDAPGGVEVAVHANLRTWPTFLWLAIAALISTGSARALNDPRFGLLTLPIAAVLWIVAWYDVQRMVHEGVNGMQVMLPPPKAAT